MATIEYKAACLLCNQPVEIDGFTLNTLTGKKQFCCAGCQSIYQLLYQDTSINNNNSPSNTEDN